MSDDKPVVLVLEDEPLLLEAIAKKLALSSMEAVACPNSEQAIEYLKSHTKLPDVVWLDFYLRERNGLEFMHEIKKNKQWEHIPVVVVSNSASPKNVTTMMELGVKKYLLKAEYRLEDIITIIKEVIEKEQKQAATS